MATEKPKQAKFSILRVIIIVSVIGFAGGLLAIFFVGFVFFNAMSGMCGTRSDAYKKEVPKVKTFNTITVLPDQPSQTATIYDSSAGVCNLDVAQAYSATKSFDVNYDGTTAEKSVTASLQSQGFTANQTTYAKDGCGNITADTAFSRNDMIIRVSYNAPKTDCYSDTPTTPLQQDGFANQNVTSIKATVSTPD